MWEDWENLWACLSGKNSGIVEFWNLLFPSYTSWCAEETWNNSGIYIKLCFLIVLTTYLSMSSLTIRTIRINMALLDCLSFTKLLTSIAGEKAYEIKLFKFIDKADTKMQFDVERMMWTPVYEPSYIPSFLVTGHSFFCAWYESPLICKCAAWAFITASQQGLHISHHHLIW